MKYIFIWNQACGLSIFLFFLFFLIFFVNFLYFVFWFLVLFFWRVFCWSISSIFPSFFLFLWSFFLCSSLFYVRMRQVKSCLKSYGLYVVKYYIGLSTSCGLSVVEYKHTDAGDNFYKTENSKGNWERE